jgi:hypothetical protein
MRRREFIPLLGGGGAWPLAVWAQAGGPKRRLGAIIGFAEDDPEVRFFVEAFDQGLRVLGYPDRLSIGRPICSNNRTRDNRRRDEDPR